MNIDVDFYELPDGTEPVRKFLNSLDIAQSLENRILNISRMEYLNCAQSRATISVGFYISFLLRRKRF